MTVQQLKAHLRSMPENLPVFVSGFGAERNTISLVAFDDVAVYLEVEGYEDDPDERPEEEAP